MRRATITLDDELEEALEAYQNAQDVRVPITAVTQAALRRFLEEQGFLIRRKGPFRLGVADAGSGISDVSAEHDKYFAESAER